MEALGYFQGCSGGAELRNLAQHKPCRASNPSPVVSTLLQRLSLDKIPHPQSSSHSLTAEQPSSVCLSNFLGGKKINCSFWLNLLLIAFLAQILGGSQRNHHHSLKLQQGKWGFCKAQRDRAATPGHPVTKREEETTSKSHPCLYKHEEMGLGNPVGFG